MRTDYSKKGRMTAFKTLHYILVIGLFYLFWILFRYNEFPQVKSTGFRYNYLVTLGFAILLVFFNRTYNSYLFGYCRIRTLALAQFLSQLFSAAIIYVAVSLGWNHLYSPWLLLLLLAIYVVIDCMEAYIGNMLYFRLNPPRRTLLIYRNPRDLRRFGNISGKPMDRLYRIVKELEFDGAFEEIRDELSRGQYDAIFVAGLNSHCRNGILKWCEEHDIRGFFLPHVGDVIMQGAQHIQAFDSPVMMARRKVLKPEYRMVKRILDFVFSAVGLLLSSPILLVTAIAIKAYDRGPVFYRQVRLTRDGKRFRIVKFRSMRTDAEKDGVARLSTGEKDDRITPVGRFIRKCRIDELPQLWNILTGDMSFVGPRPERPEIAEKYCEQMPDFKLRLQVKAGLTGYAQIYGKYNTEPYEKLEFDLMYINQMSLLTDLELMFATAGILLKKESTEGIQQGNQTAMDYDT